MWFTVGVFGQELPRGSTKLRHSGIGEWRSSCMVLRHHSETGARPPPIGPPTLENLGIISCSVLNLAAPPCVVGGLFCVVVGCDHVEITRALLEGQDDSAIGHEDSSALAFIVIVLSVCQDFGDTFGGFFAVGGDNIGKAVAIVIVLCLRSWPSPYEVDGAASASSSAPTSSPKSSSPSAPDPVPGMGNVAPRHY